MKFDPFKLYRFKFDDDGYFSGCLLPRSLAVCPCCGKRLVAEADSWERGDEDAYWIPLVKIDCIRGMECWDENKYSEPNRMPYVYWLPLEMKCNEWVRKMLRVYFKVDPMPQKWLDRNGQRRLNLKAA